MKKSIFVLLVLLATLIVTCVYQKTYTIYSNSPKELTLIEIKTTPQSESTTKTVAVEEKTSTLTVVSVPSPVKPVEIKPAPEAKPIIEVKSVVQTEKVAPEGVKEKDAPSTKKSALEVNVPTVQPSRESVPPAESKQQSNTESTHRTEPITGEEEIVDYIMWALNNREIALKNRDEVQARIKELITKALNDRLVALAERKVVLDERDAHQVELIKNQTEQIDARDASYESVTNPKTTNQGEK